MANLWDIFQNLHYREIQLLTSLVNNANLETLDESSVANLVEIFNGAHLVLYDNGAMYDNLAASFPELIHKRWSSHVSDRQQFSFWGDNIHECLFATRELTEEEKIAYPDIKTLTWLQLENSHTRTFWSVLKHLLDYFIYVFTGKNVGPMGLSHHTDKNPLVLMNTAIDDDLGPAIQCSIL